ncbi:hypothetical protein AB0N33_16310 [Pseudarthrobacter oxydans]|uniref:hypothetical protein n=2 Tax=Micrococcaceae TaxID=1268 RepID=UPI0034338052
MPQYFSGPSSPQMRLTMLLVGLVALVAGIYSGTHEIRASAASGHGNVVNTNCGSAFNQYDSELRDANFPALSAACEEAVGVWPVIAFVLLAVAAIILIRLLYMLIGPKIAPS